MSDAFDACLAEILKQEGGYVWDKHDPGGETMLGVTRKTWGDWIGKPVPDGAMRKLTPADVAPLYRKNYWQASGADKLPAAIALCVFDFAVNAGPSRAARFLQNIVGTPADGKIGAGTLAAVLKWQQAHGPTQLATAYQNARRDYYRSLPTFKFYGKGWLARVDDVEAKAKELAS